VNDPKHDAAWHGTETEPGRCTDQYPWGQRWITCARRKHRRGKHRAHHGVHIVTWKLVGWR